jgi:hypothetical protein
MTLVQLLSLLLLHFLQMDFLRNMLLYRLEIRTEKAPLQHNLRQLIQLLLTGLVRSVLNDDAYQIQNTHEGMIFKHRAWSLGWLGVESRGQLVEQLLWPKELLLVTHTLGHLVQVYWEQISQKGKVFLGENAVLLNVSQLIHQKLQEETEWWLRELWALDRLDHERD